MRFIMTKKRIIIITSAVLVLVLLAVGLWWYLTPGVRILGPFARVNLSGTGYILDTESLTVTGQTPVIIDVAGVDLSVWDASFGEIRIEEYQPDGDGSPTMIKLASACECGEFRFHHWMQYYSPSYSPDEHGYFINYLFSVHIVPGYPDAVMVTVSAGSDEGGNITMVLAKDETAAIDYWKAWNQYVHDYHNKK